MTGVQTCALPIYVLTKYPERPCLVIGADGVTFLCPPRLSLPTQAGDVVSLFPMAPVPGRSVPFSWVTRYCSGVSVAITSGFFV